MAVTVLNDKIYACGGFNGVSRLKRFVLCLITFNLKTYTNKEARARELRYSPKFSL